MNAASEGCPPIGRFWKTVDPITVMQAAALVAGLDPSTMKLSEREALLYAKDGLTGAVEDANSAFAAIRNAIETGKLKAKPAYRIRYAAINSAKPEAQPAYFYGDRDYKDADWGKTTVAVADLRAWLERTDIRPAFFFPGEPKNSPAINGATFAKLQAVLDAYPAKYGGRDRVKLDTDLRPWLRQSHGCSVSEADVFGAIIAEHFALKTGRR